ncbi:FadR/GntR family transcriptional regulator [Rhodococcus sp. NPDC056960]|uniref:FadR/GntR family transcriptional regulator n=1 Tax=Rhodococcus sp. NPDC056960 TaxID=3345982 RepID=UPI00362CB048
MPIDQLGGLTALGAVLAPLDGGGPRTDAVVERISAAIGLGVMVDGEQLPPELDLASQLGVSTVTLREALAVLRNQGLVHTKRGRGGGSFVKASADVVQSNSLTRLQQLSVEELRDIGDEHFAISGAAATLAARRSLSTDVTRLRGLVTRMRETADPFECRRADSRFHIEVAVSSQSSRLTRTEVSLQAELSAMIWLPQVAVNPAEEADTHHALVDAIEAENSDLARELAEAHSVAHIRRLIKLRMELRNE